MLNAAPTLLDVRPRIGSIIEVAAAVQQDVIVLAIDGINHDIASACWPNARTERLSSLFPTTSSACWLSSLTAQTVDAHGIPGVVFRIPDQHGPLINIYDYQGKLGGPDDGNIFSDAAALGYQAVSVLGDLASYPCSWRNRLLQHSVQRAGNRHFVAADGSYQHASRRAIVDRIETSIDEALRPPCLLWCFIEVDAHVHRYGYDDFVAGMLADIEAMAIRYVEQGKIVAAYSDHGQTKTAHDPELAGLLGWLASSYEFTIGGAGRTRWVYPMRANRLELASALRDRLPADIAIIDANTEFAAGSLARARVGDLLLVANGEDFVAPKSYRFEHGSKTEAEVWVPFSVWDQ